MDKITVKKIIHCIDSIHNVGIKNTQRKARWSQRRNKRLEA